MPSSGHWAHAMEEKLHQLDENRTWDLHTTWNQVHKALSGRRVFKVKRNEMAISLGLKLGELYKDT